MGYDFEIKYKPGSTNIIADALSRCHDKSVELGALVVTTQIHWQKLHEEIQGDETLQRIREDIQAGTQNWPGYDIVNGWLVYNNRVVIPPQSTIIPRLLYKYHDSPAGGHL